MKKRNRVECVAGCVENVHNNFYNSYVYENFVHGMEYVAAVKKKKTLFRFIHILISEMSILTFQKNKTAFVSTPNFD